MQSTASESFTPRGSKPTRLYSEESRSETENLIHSSIPVPEPPGPPGFRNRSGAPEYNLVGFDPLGVNDSAAVDCITDAEMDAWRAQDVDTSTDAGLAAYAAEMEVYGKRCAENTGELLGHLDTDNAARDLDVLRAVVGRTDTLDYLGYSYGTFLGAVYADLFTERVGRFTLD